MLVSLFIIVHAFLPCVSLRNCLFRALGDQLEGHSRGHLRMRQETVQYMQAHRQDFEPFVEDDIPFTEYCKGKERGGGWKRDERRRGVKKGRMDG